MTGKALTMRISLMCVSVAGADVIADDQDIILGIWMSEMLPPELGDQLLKGPDTAMVLCNQ